MNATRIAKRRMREEMCSLLRSTPMEPGFAEAAATLVVALPAFARAGAVALYAAMPDEVSTCPMQRAAREAGKRRLLPRICEDRRLEFAECGRWEDLRPGRYRVLEPPADAAVLALCDVDLVVVPGLAFDRRGGRLGRGGGYYDRALAEARGRSGGGGPFVVGLTSSNQLVEEVPREAFDQLVDVVVTERELIAREPTRT